MTLAEFKKTMFARYLLALPKERRIQHLWDCLKLPRSENENMGWMLMILVHGDRFDISDKTMAEALQALN